MAIAEELSQALRGSWLNNPYRMMARGSIIRDDRALTLHGQAQMAQGMAAMASGQPGAGQPGGSNRPVNGGNHNGRNGA